MIRKASGAAALLAAGLFCLAAWAHEGPHGGELFQAAKHKYHAELVIDKAARQATVYILDGRAKKAVPIKARTIEMYVAKGDAKPLILNASPQKGEQGVSSRFIAKDDRLGGKIAVSAVSFRIRVDEAKAAYIFTPEHDD